MTRSQLVRRYLWAVLFAAVLASVFHRLKADECDPNDPNATCFVVYRPGMCAFLEPGTWWYEFWCSGQNAEASATAAAVEEGRVVIETVPMGDYLLIRMGLRMPDGSVVWQERLVPRVER